MRARHARLAILAIALAIVAACGDDDATTTANADTTTTVEDTTTVGAETSTTASEATTTTTAEATTSSSAFAGDTGPESGPVGPGVLSATLVDVRWAQREEGFTRVVFDFGGTAVPAYNIRYDPGPFFTTMGEGGGEVAVDGNTFILVHITPARRFDLSGDSAVQTYSGPERIDPASASVEEIVFVDDFEAEMIWVIGVSEQKPFAVGTLTGPPRIYIDIAD